MTSSIATEEEFAHSGRPWTRMSRKIEDNLSFGMLKLRMASAPLEESKSVQKPD